MSSIASIALSGLQLAQQRMSVSAHNIANAATEGFQRQSVVAESVPGGGVLGRVERSDEASAGLQIADAVDLLESKQLYAANLAVLRSESERVGSLLDILA